jgi:hypothetical protein
VLRPVPSACARLAQVVYTVTRLPDIDAVAFEIEGEAVTVFSSEGIELDGPQQRDDYYDLLPRIFVDHPAWAGGEQHQTKPRRPYGPLREGCVSGLTMPHDARPTGAPQAVLTGLNAWSGGFDTEACSHDAPLLFAVRAAGARLDSHCWVLLKSPSRSSNGTCLTQPLTCAPILALEHAFWRGARALHRFSGPPMSTLEQAWQGLRNMTYASTWRWHG